MFSEAKDAAAATEGTLTKDLMRPEAEADPESVCLRWAANASFAEGNPLFPN